MTAAIEWGLLGQLVWVALAAGVVVAVCFSLTIVGGVRAGDARRAGRDVAAVAYGALAVLSGGAIAALVVAGVAVIVAK